MSPLLYFALLISATYGFHKCPKRGETKVIDCKHAVRTAMELYTASDGKSAQRQRSFDTFDAKCCIRPEYKDALIKCPTDLDEELITGCEHGGCRKHGDGTCPKDNQYAMPKAHAIGANFWYDDESESDEVHTGQGIIYQPAEYYPAQYLAQPVASNESSTLVMLVALLSGAALLLVCMWFVMVLVCAGCYFLGKSERNGYQAVKVNADHEV
eukprot:CAMPEP_0197035410 /NCGR_PEP_ID=MMETSP1384-20130603/13227_1 /TAXON_ID=29189 /ORGANISM="Ammonia sp." /LENGTH=211 /DNA_ID=CAMNT_0042465475 /DNA_START=28 /DNA_END=663 /DNA_ORIENTATION=+